MAHIPEGYGKRLLFAQAPTIEIYSYNPPHFVLQPEPLKVLHSIDEAETYCRDESIKHEGAVYVAYERTSSTDMNSLSRFEKGQKLARKQLSLSHKLED